MKITAIILLAACLQVSARSAAQGTVSLSTTNAPLDKVFAEIRKQTGYSFVYTESQLKATRPVTLRLKDAPLDKALEACFAQQPFTWELVDKSIVVKPREVASALVPATPPPTDIHGRVTDSAGNPLAGASVTVKGTKKAVATTDEKGDFELRGIDPNETIIISYTGYMAKQIKLRDRTSIEVVLERSNSPLDEVHVIAYGTQTQRFNVGSVSKVTAVEIASQPVSNPLAALEGRVPGLVVTQTSGIPGASFNVQIRGQNSLKPNNSSPSFLPPFDKPLFIIDGVPYAPQNANLNQFRSLASPGGNVGDSYNNPYGGISPFNSISPSDIESIEVLKDADATAIYGSRGANGVILITTKKGKAGKTKFNANISTGNSWVPLSLTPQMMNTKQYLTMRHEAFENDNAAPDPVYDPDVNGMFDTTSYTDWKKYFLSGVAKTTDASASLSGGNVNTQFLIGAAYHRETYIFPGDFADNRMSVNMNLNHKSTDQRLFIDFSANYSYDKNNSGSNASVLQAFSIPPDYPALLDANGNLNWRYNGSNLNSNPLAYLKQPYNGQTYNLLSHFQAGYEILPGLTIQSSFGYNTTNYNEYSNLPKSSQNPAFNRTSYAYFGTNNFQTWIIEPQINFKRSLGKGSFEALAGGTFQQNINSSTSLQGSNYSNDALLGSISAAGTKTVNGDAYTLYKYNAAFGRLNYIWARKYIINFTGRRDGSSRFGPGRQFGNFGSVGGGWIFSEEPLVKSLIPALSYGKLRVSYGTTGSDNIGDYQYIANWKPTPNSYQGQAGYIPQNLYQPDFSWEVNKKLEMGLESGFFADRLYANFSWFQNRCGNQLITYTLPVQTGFTGVTSNFQALVQNTGFELQLSSTNIKTKEFTWKSSFNISVPKNKLVSFPGLSTSSYANIYVVGQSTSILQKFKFLGVNDTTGLFQFLTAKGAPTYSPMPKPVPNGGDYQIIGNLDPMYYGGLRNTFAFKGIQLDVFLQFSKQLAPNYLQQIYGNGTPGLPNNLPALLNSRWQKPGDHSVFQRFSQDGSADESSGDFATSDAAYSDASYIRVKTISFSYNLKASFIKRVKMEGCRIYINAQNLFTITKYKGDPETQSFYGVPPLKTIVAGLQFTF